MLEFHPYADIFPLLEGAAFEELVADVRAHGLREPIVVHEGKILDGRNRWRAGCAAGRLDDAKGAWFSRDVLNDGFREFGSEAGEADPLAFVISKNLHRRHLTESQRAMVAARLATLRPGRPPAPGPSPPGGGEQETPPIGGISAERAGEIIGVGERSIERAKRVLRDGVGDLVRAVERGEVKVSAAAAIATLAPVEQEAALVTVGSPEFAAEMRRLKARATDEKKARRETREAELGSRQRALPQARFGVILADPEWRFEVRSRDTGLDRAADNHYPTSASDVIMARPVAAIAADDAVLFLWATVPMLPDALAVMKAWGFAYKSHFAWVKGTFGTGYWNRNRHELLLVGSRGNVPAPAMGTQWDSVIEAHGGVHSQKPEQAYELIEAYFPTLPKIELNARAARVGWAAWGLEAPQESAEPVAPPSSGADAPPSPHEGEKGGAAAAVLITDHRSLFPGAAA